jgi:hypothetical protein
MTVDLRKLVFWPSVFAGLFFLIPVLLFFSHPNSFWVNTDYEPLGLGDALNMAYRLADHHLYPAVGMSYHPGVPFYFMGWLALALAGHPVASANSGFFDAVMEDVERYHQIVICLAALTGAVGVYIFARVARKLVPIGLVVASLLLWLVSSPATLQMFLSPSIDSFAILTNSLFFAVLVRIAYDDTFAPTISVVAGCVGAFAYLNKLSYIYIPLALAGVGLLNFALRRSGWAKAGQISLLFVLIFVLVVVAVGHLVIGSSGYHDLLNYHKSVFYGSGLYGAGDPDIVSRVEVGRALLQISADRAYAVWIALFGGVCIGVAGLFTGLKDAKKIPVAVIAIGAGAAAVLSALIVLKHYELHYTAGVSATLPAMAVGAYLLGEAWGLRSRIVVPVLAAIAILWMGNGVTRSLVYGLTSQMHVTELAKDDVRDLRADLAGIKGSTEVAYRAPFAWYGEGFVIVHASVPRLTKEYLQSRQDMISSLTVGLEDRQIGAYIIDKGYFPTVESVKTSSNVALLGPKPVVYRDGDKLIELRTVFLLIPG